MAEGIPEIDTSVLDDLLAIRHEQAQLVQFRARAEEMKARVDQRVYERVTGDYDRRDASLLERAQPLEARARVEFRKLVARTDEITETRRRAEFDKAEIEFRHSVGEIDDAQLAERVTAPESVLAACQAELEALDALRARFVEAYQNVEADAAKPEAPAAAPAPPAPAPDPAPAPAPDPPPPVAQAVVAPPPPVPEAVVAPPPPVPEAVVPPVPEVAPEAAPVASNVLPLVRAEEPAPSSSPATSDLSADLFQAPTQMFEVPADLFAKPAAPPATPEVGSQDTDGDATFILPDAILVDAAHGATEFRLGAMNYIGRADDNQIRLKSGDISRRHAMISVANGVYLLRDLQSQNGTFVNGQRIAEHVLADGDRVRVGNIELVFHYASANRQDTGSGIVWATPGS